MSVGARLLIIQFAGDFREAYYRLSGGGEESYFAQRYSVDEVSALVQQDRAVTVVVCVTDEEYDEVLPTGVRAIGLGRGRNDHESKALKYAKAWQPTHVLLRAPFTKVLRWAVEERVALGLTLADSFNERGLRNQWRHRTLARQLNSPAVSWIGNHGVNSCRSLQAIGVSPAKIVPWDWPGHIDPKNFPPKPAPAPGAEWHMAFVGSVTQLKGVGDLLQGMSLLLAEGRRIRLTIAGGGSIDEFVALSLRLALAERVRFVGAIGNKKVIPLMREADLVVVPSRTKYPEGFPLTIYEALTARTPIVSSEHPMFRRILRDGQTAVTFESGDVKGIAAAIGRIMDSPQLYEHLSMESRSTWARLQLPVKWGEFVSAWLDEGVERWNWLRANSLASGHYD